MIGSINQRNFMFLSAYFGTDTSTKSKTESVGFEHHFASYKDFPKGDLKMSEEEFEKAIFELGQKEYNLGIAGNGRPSKEMQRLMMSYLSSVAPDRDKIITNALNSIPFRLRGSQLGYSEFYNANGEKIADYCPKTGWTKVGTKAEGIRSAQFYSFYIAGIKEAMNAEKSANTSAPITGIAIDEKA